MTVSRRPKRWSRSRRAPTSAPALAVVDRGYRGHDVRGTQVLISGMRRRLAKGLKAQLRRRSAIEPEIDHMKTDGRLAQCPLKGNRGDAVFAVLCGCGRNIRKILAQLRVFLALLLVWIAAAGRPYRTANGSSKRIGHEPRMTA